MPVFEGDVGEAGVLGVRPHVGDLVRSVDLDPPFLRDFPYDFLGDMLGYAKNVVVLGVLGEWGKEGGLDGRFIAAEPDCCPLDLVALLD